ncbi:MAG TPA: flagellar hook-associated protein FlgK [Caulobacteraceae bacterium]|jgi:flagellar hook-associated protein 1 FlgK
MSVNGLMTAALSGLQTAQTALTTVSNNITNINTPGYAREVVQQSPAVVNGGGDGVTVDDVQRVTNQFLEAASYNASSAAGSSGIVSTLLDQAQAAFGDPSQGSSYLNQLSTVFADFTAAANDPASNLPRSQIVGDLNSFLDNTSNVASTLGGLSTQTQSQLSSDVSQVNKLLSQVNTLNQSITTTVGLGSDASGAQDSQSQLLGQLSNLMSINVASQSNGTVVVRSSTGQLLVGFGSSATLSYTPSNGALAAITVQPAGSPGSGALQVGDGEMQGLLSLNNTLIPGLQQQLSAYVGGAVSALNAVHNSNTAVPPPQSLSGRNTGLDLPTIAGDFSGVTNIAIVGANSAVQQQVKIDFSARTMSVNGGAATSFTPSSFLASLNTALGGAGTASFSGGALSLKATAAGSGVAIADDAATPAQDGGQGFSQFFGLNDLVTSSQITNYATGLRASDASGFTPGGVVSFQVASPSGAPMADIDVTVPPAGSPSMQDLLNAMNAPIGGLGQYGSFSLDAQGALAFTPTAPGVTLAVANDTTQRGLGGPSVSQLFGLGSAQLATAASSYQVNANVDANPMNMALGKLDLSAAAGTPAVAAGDGTGATQLAAVAGANAGFPAAGTLPAMTTTIAQYAANLAGAIGQQASAAGQANTQASAVQTETQTRLQSVEGVNLDQELVNLTTYQQAYNASARLIQASQNLVNTLLDMVP